MNLQKTAFKQRLKTWFQYKKRMFLLWWYDTPKSRRDLEKGIYYLRKGTLYQVGQPFKIVDKHTGKARVRYIDNLFFNYKTNQVTHRFSDKPIKGLTEQFEAKG